MKLSFKPAAVLLISIMVISLMACSSNKQLAVSSTTAATSEVKSTETPEATPAPTPEPTAENVKLKIFAQYTSNDEKATFDYARDAMKKIMPNVDLDIDVQPQDNGVKLKTFMATGTLPDIVLLNSLDMATAVKSNSIISLDDYVQKQNLADQLSPSGLDMFKQLDGHTYAAPYANSLFAFIYINKALFEQAGAKIPENYDEFLAAVKALSAKKIVPLGIWYKETWAGLQFFDFASVSDDPKGNINLDVKGNGKVSDPAYVNAAKKISELVKAGLISKDSFSMTYDQAVANFEGGKAAMFILGNWLGQEVGDKLGDKAGMLLPYVLADASKAQAVKDSGAFSGGGFPGGYAVSSNSKYKDIAANYAVQFALKQVEGRIVKTGELNTVLKNPPAPEKPFNAYQQLIADTAKTIKTLTIMPWSFESSKIETDLAGEVQKLFTGQYTPDEFAKNTDKLIEQDRKQ